MKPVATELEQLLRRIVREELAALLDERPSTPTDQIKVSDLGRQRAKAALRRLGISPKGSR